MIYREKDADYQSALYYDLLLDDIDLSDYDGSAEQLQHLLNIDCALALSVCKSRNFPSCVFVLSLLYMKRLRSLRGSSTLTKIDDLTTKELYLVATLLANKYLVDEGEDEQLFNSELAELAEITTERVNLIERQVLIALNWNLHIPNDEYQQFFTLFKCQMARKLHKTAQKLSTEDPMKFYNLCLQFLPQAVECLALTSLVLLGSTISILTAIHVGTLTQSALMKTLQPPTSCAHPSMCYWSKKIDDRTYSHHPALLDDHERANASRVDQNKFFEFDEVLPNVPTDFTNETTDSSITPFFHLASCSMDLLRSHSFPRVMVPALG